MLSTLTPAISAQPTLTTSAAEIIPKAQQQQSPFGSSFGKVLLSEDSPRTVDELIRARAKSDPDFSVIAYPWTGTTYTHYTFRQLDVYAYRMAKKYAEVLPPRRSASEEPTVVGVLGLSTFDYFVTMLALTKLGHTCLLMSTRIVQEAYSSLIRNTGARYMVVDANFGNVSSALSKEWPDLKVLPMATRADYEKPISEAEAAVDTNLTPQLDPEMLKDQPVWIIHSSGSTSLPKPISLTHLASMYFYSVGLSMSGLLLGPLFHLHGESCTFRAIFNKYKVYHYNAELPMTRQYLIDIIKNNDLEILFGVPYTLSLLAETDEGIQCLKKFTLVTFGGSPCPDALGDRLIAEGVNLMATYGATETGMIMSSQRPPEDKAWNYLRPAWNAGPYLRFEERDECLYELVVLDGWKSKMLTNRPDGHYNTKDCFLKHPSIPNAWKYYCRFDDALTLVNAEKANPLQVEGHARQSRFVEHALMFGAGRDRLGLAVILTKAAENKSRDEILDDIFKAIEPAHNALPAYAKIDRDMVLMLPAGTQCRCTDKKTVIRQPFYRQFASEIDAMYDDAATGTLVLSEPELRDFIRKQVAALTDESELSDDTDFFAVGMDSLQTARLRTALTKHLDIGGQQLGLNVVFEHPSIAALAQHFSLRTAASSTTDTVAGIPAEKIAEMEAMIERYSTPLPLPPPSQTNTSEKGHVVLLTGATGSLGAHIAAQLAALPSVTLVYCLVRAHDAEHASKRLDESFRTRHLQLSDASRAKLAPLCSDLSRDDLGLDADTRQQVEQHVSHVLVVGWAVNFTVALRSFEAENVAGVRRLLELAARSARAARFTFASSVSVVGNVAAMQQQQQQQQTGGPLMRVDEALPPSPAAALNMGYGQSKLVTEHVCMRAAEQAPRLRSRVLRVGQIAGDTLYGVWNTTEAVPLMLRTATTLGALPALDDTVRWVAADDAARAFVEVGVLGEAPAAVYNVINPHAIHWTRDLLPMLRECGLEFETVSVAEWLERLRRSEKDPAKNPPIKLLAFWEQHFCGERAEVEWATERVREWSPTMARLQATDKGLVQKMVDYFVQEGWK